MPSSTLVTYQLPTDDWFSVNTLAGFTVGKYMKIYNNSNVGGYLFKGDQPSINFRGGALLSPAFMDGCIYGCENSADEIWIRGKGLAFAVESGTDGTPPEGIYEGLRAMTFQEYSEANKKNATQFAASRLITATNTTTQYDSILVLGDKPIDLKSREFAYTGLGVIADIFENPTYTITGETDPVYSANGITASNFDFLLYAGVAFTLSTTGTKFAPTIYAIGPTSQQSKGQPNGLYGSNYILSPNKSYLLRFSSRDTQSQEIAVRIEGYNGFLDLPRP